MKKIMFDDRFGLTQAVLDGRKTQTRRLILKPSLEKIQLFKEQYYNATLSKLEGVELLVHYFFTEKIGKLPYQKDEVVAVAQSYKAVFEEQQDDTLEMLDLSLCAGWNNKMFVRADLMPHQIRITNVRIERLQYISEEDCLKEGINEATREYPWYWFTQKDKRIAFNEQRKAFASLVDKVSGKGTWEKNPYVWVYDFVIIK